MTTPLKCILLVDDSPRDVEMTIEIEGVSK